MKKTLLVICLAFLSLGATASHAVEPPTASPATGAIVPTSTNLRVTLSASEGAEIFYSLNDGADVLYTTPISLTGTTTIEAFARESVGVGDLDLPIYETSTVAVFEYKKNTLPTVSIILPEAGDEFQAGDTVRLRATASDADTDDSVTEVRYYSGATLLGTGNTGANRMFNWVDAPAGTHSLTAVAVDENGGSKTSTAISIIVRAPNAAPVANAGANAATTVGATAIALNGSASSDPEETDLTFAWAGPVGTGYTLTGAATASPTVSFTAAGSYTFTLTVTDAAGLTDTDEMVVQVGIKPAITSALTASGEVGEPFTYTITATGTTPIAYTATGLTGTGLTLAGAVISGTPTSAGTKNVTLTATNATYGADSKILAITVTAANAAPVADAGANTTTTVGAAAIKLDGTGSSDPEETVLTYLWTGPTGTGYTLTGATTATPSVAFTTVGSYTFTLKVTDKGAPAASATDEVVVQVFQKPAITSPLVASGTVGTAFSHPVTASGTAPIAYSATGLPAPLVINATTGAITGTPTSAGADEVTVTATNAHGEDSKTLTITISAANQAPATAISSPANNSTHTAPYAGPIRATASDDGAVDSVVFFNGTTRLGKGTGPTAGAFSFTPAGAGLAAGEYVLTTRAYDDEGAVGNSPPISITVTAPPPNQTPTATLTAPVHNSTHTAPYAATLTATAADADGTVAGVEFFSNGVSIGEDPTSPYSLSHSFAAGTHILTAKATDNEGLVGPASTAVNITVTAANGAPVADAGANTTTTVGAAAIKLDGTGSSDPEDSVLTYLWTGPTGGGYTLTGLTTATPSVSFTAVGSYTFTLRVTDKGTPVGSATDQVVVEVFQKPAITSGLAASGTVGTAFSHTVTATGTAPIAYSATGLPAPLALNATTGAITGTPTAAGSFKVDLTATNLHGTDSKTLTITISASNKAPVTAITSPANNSTHYVPYTDPIRATASDDGDVDSVVFYNGTTRLGKGTGPAAGVYSFTPPSAGQVPGEYELTARAYDDEGAVGTSAPVSINLRTNAAPTAKAGNDTIVILTANSVSVALKGSASTDPEGADLSYLWTVPPGVAIVGSGAVSPTPTLQFTNTGSQQIILTVTDAGKPARSHSDTVIVTVRTVPVITSPTTASGNLNAPFSYVMTASASPAPALSVGNLPAWLSWNAGTRSLSGTPTSTGAFSVVMTASNLAGSSSKTLAITIGGALTKPVINSPLTASVKSGNPFSYVVTANGTTPITFGATGLPSGLTYSPGTATIQGTPTATGNFAVNLSATNTYGKDSRILTLAVTADPAITLDLDTLYTVIENGSVMLRIAATGFPAPTYQWQVGSSRTNLGNTGASTSNTLIINPATLGAAGYYRVIVRNGAGPEKISRIARLAVTPLPVPIRIVAGSGPTAQTATAGQRVVLKTKATGEAPLRYQWFKGSVAVTSSPTVNDTTFILPAVTVSDAGVYRARVTNAHTVETNPSTYAWSDTARLTVNLPKLPRTRMLPDTGAFFPTMTVSLSNDTPGTRIYYTLDRSAPSETVSARNYLYQEGSPITLTATTAITTRSYKAGFLPSDERVETYTLTPPDQVLKPFIRPPTPTFQGSLLCTLATNTPGALIYYSTDGSIPSGPSARVFDKEILLDSTTTLIAVARKPGMVDSDTLMTTYTLETPTPNVFDPQAEPRSKSFSGRMAVSLFSPTDSAAIWYTTDGSQPDTTKTRYIPGFSITIARTTELKFMATRKGFLNSAVVTENYKLVPGNFSIQPPPGLVFDSAITVTVSAVPANAEIRYEIGGADPSATSAIFPAEGLRITTTTNFSVIAVDGTDVSETVRFSYTKRGDPLATPIPKTALGSNTFKDTVKVFLSSTPGADIHFTLNGGVPNADSERYTASGILLDTTTTIQAVAIHPAFQNSRNMVATYTLAPDKPTASPPGGSTPDPVYVKLKTTSRLAQIYYTLDGSHPAPSNRLPYVRGDSILIEASAVLKSVAVAGHMSSPVAEESYEIFGEETILLPPGNNASLRGGYTLRNPEGQNASVSIWLSGIDTLNLSGFENVQYGMTLSLHGSDASAADGFPSLTFTRPASDKRMLYKLDPSGKVFFVTSKDTATLSQAGIYFTGIDVSPPVIRYVGEFFDAKDSTEVRFRIEDNVANLVYDLKRSDSLPLGIIQGSLASPKDLSVKLKNPAGSVKPLYLQVFVSDYQSPSFFPVDPKAWLALSQRMKAFKGPPSWKIGVNPNAQYDLVSIPLNLSPALNLKTLNQAAGNPGLEGVVWNGVDGYVRLKDDVVLQPGTGYWLASRKTLTALSLATATTLPNPANTFSVRLSEGWNQVGNPHMEDLYWPIVRDEKYSANQVKGLWEFDPKSNDFVESQVMKPWRGYFVYSFVPVDTTVSLLREPKQPDLVAKKTTASYHGYRLSLGWGSARSLQLGADRFSVDGLGMEDEFSLPRPARGPFMRAVRDGKSLMSDWVRLETDGILAWKVALDGDGDSLAPIRILGHDLPEGFETWAASQSRSMKFKLENGAEFSSSGLAKDTLLVYAGPRAKMAAFRGLQDLLDKAPDLDLRVSARNGGFLMHMALPTRAKLKATVWALNGTNKGDMRVGPLSEGIYKFSYQSHFRGGKNRLAPGMYFLSVEIQGDGLPRRLTRKIILAN